MSRRWLWYIYDKKMQWPVRTVGFWALLWFLLAGSRRQYCLPFRPVRWRRIAVREGRTTGFTVRVYASCSCEVALFIDGQPVGLHTVGPYSTFQYIMPYYGTCGVGVAELYAQTQADFIVRGMLV